MMLARDDMRLWVRKTDGCAAALAAFVLVGCQPGTAQGGAAACSPPAPWPGAGARPGQPELELAACLRDRAYQARSVAVPVEAKVAGIIAQCEVGVDRFEGSMIFGGATGSDEQRRAAEQWEMRQATAAVGAYQTCESR
jgi:hypothetical protein